MRCRLPIRRRTPSRTTGRTSSTPERVGFRRSRSGRICGMTLMAEPTEDGRFGEFGGRFVPETLIPACFDLEDAFRAAWADAAFRRELDELLRDYAGRPSPLTECANLGARLGLRLLLKREDLNHTGSHKINNVIGQALLARRMGKSRLV